MNPCSCGHSSVLDDIARLDNAGLALIRDAMRLSARGYHRVLKVARTLADLDDAANVSRVHLAEALSYRALSKKGDARRDAFSITARSRIEVGTVMPSDLAAPYFTTTVVPTGTRL